MMDGRGHPQTRSTTLERLPASLLAFPLDLVESGGERVPHGALLRLEMQRQEQSNWCWSAVGASIGIFRGTGAWTQCRVATLAIPQFPGGTLDLIDCCVMADRCDIYGYLDVSLATTGTFDDLIAGRIDFDDLEAELLVGHPVCVRVAWHSGGAHFVVVCGCVADEQGGRYVDVVDPGSGSLTTQLFDGPAGFPAAYFGGGNWTHTYFTK